jgi:hypothetical protein
VVVEDSEGTVLRKPASRASFLLAVAQAPESEALQRVQRQERAYTSPIWHTPPD